MASILLMAGVPASAMTPTHDELSMITPAPTMRELQKRRGGRGGGGGGGGGAAADFKYDTTCGLIPHSLALQYGMYGLDTSSAAGNDPYPLTCNGLCANMGNYLGCIAYKTASVPSACHDYAATKTGTARCTSGDPCYWDKTCSYNAPYCNQNIYQGSITQFTCGASKYAPITVQTPVKMVPYTPVLANETSAATSTPPPVTLQSVLGHVGLSIAGFAGICVAVGLVLFGVIGYCCWKKRRARKGKVFKEVNYAKMETPYQQHSPAGSGTYHHYQQHSPTKNSVYHYQEPAPSYQQPLMSGHGQQQGYYQGYDQGYHNQYQHQR
ncbi:hypothetical protein H2198_002766 [Neophaeococcomyces mojaviensis]|uniref:Uncharacterized protein n=1 Tax=Neophaeococcomyces mojaviensis TaxID=3383035 RepID=A0ACC3AD79_9EURO|nr:hypothetical protein H2198_002766 [Knufia sp. JES_112]